MNIGGKIKEKTSLPEFSKKVGLFEANVIAINPDAEEYKDVLGIEISEESKALEYLGTSQDGNKTLRVDVWLEEVKNKDRFKVTFFLEDKTRENKDGSKTQYINNIGVCSWATDENNLPDWFKKRDYREANVGEEDLMNFLRTWFSKLDYRDNDTVLELDWKKIMKGNLSTLKAQIGGEYCDSFVALATIKTVIKEDETKEYQGVYNKAFMPTYCLKNFRLINFNDAKVVDGLKSKKSKDLKPHERFVLDVAGEYGCRDFYVLKDIKDYNPEDNFAASDKAIADDDSSY